MRLSDKSNWAPKRDPKSGSEGPNTHPIAVARYRNAGPERPPAIYQTVSLLLLSRPALLKLDEQPLSDGTHYVAEAKDRIVDAGGVSRHRSTINGASGAQTVGIPAVPADRDWTKLEQTDLDVRTIR